MSRGWGERIVSSNICFHADSDEAILQGGVIGEVITLNKYGVVLLFSPLETQLKVITSAASSVTSRNKLYNHVLHQSANLLGIK